MFTLLSTIYKHVFEPYQPTTAIIIYFLVRERHSSRTEGLCATLHDLGHKDDLVALLPHRRLKRLTREHVTGEAYLDVTVWTKGTVHLLTSNAE